VILDMMLPLRQTLISMEGVPPSCGSREAERLEDLRDVRGARPARDREFSQQRRATYRRLISRRVSYTIILPPSRNISFFRELS
jgi:hypothetical protein